MVEYQYGLNDVCLNGIQDPHKCNTTNNGC